MPVIFGRPIPESVHPPTVGNAVAEAAIRECPHCAGDISPDGAAFLVHTSFSRRHRQYVRVECVNCAWQCADCEDWFSRGLWDDSHCNANDQRICEACSENYDQCSSCDNIFHHDNMVGDACDECHNFEVAGDDEDEDEAEPIGLDAVADDELRRLQLASRQAARNYDIAPTGETAQAYNRASQAYTDAVERQRADTRSQWPPPRAINEYNYKPAPRFHGADIATVPADMPFYGLEVEAESMGNTLQSIERRIRIDPVWYAKHDGSLRSGAEFVSHPGTFKAWMQHDFGLLTDLQGIGWRSYDTTTCGMHVHIRRTAFSQLGIVKLMRLFRVHQDLFLKLSRRRNRDALNQFSRINTRTDGELRELASRDWSHQERYAAVNLENKHTVEIRIFRGTLDPAGIKRNIALCHTLVMFVRDNGIRDMTMKGFATWISKNAEPLCGKVIGGSLKKWILDATHVIEDKGH